MTNRLKTFLNKLIAWNRTMPYRLEDVVSMLVMLLLLLDVALQVVTRYVFSHPLGWTEEIARYLLILLTFVGAPIAVRNNSNVSLDFLFVNASARVKHVLGLFSSVVELILYALCTKLAWNITVFSLNRYLVTIRLSKGLIYGIITAAFVLMTVRCAMRLVRQVRDMGKGE